MSKGQLILFPTPLSDKMLNYVLPQHNIDRIKTIKYFIAEDAKTARRFLKLCGYENIQEAEIMLLNEHTNTSNYSQFIEQALMGNDIGLMSDAGCPGIADPGAEVVRAAHQKQIKVTPLVGPSSIVLTIMASGFNGQNFAFNGYLPIDRNARLKKLKDLESFAIKYRQAQYFIETPYRNIHLFKDILDTLNASTNLCLGINLTSANELIMTYSVAEWRKKPIPEIHKVPVVFGLYF